MTDILAPPLPDTLEWLNVAGTMPLVPAPGRLTALAFVNLGSAWSQQRLRDLDALRARHAPHLHVIGLHAPRFDHERDSRRMRRQLHRQDISVPVAHDPDWLVWQQYAVTSWPTVLLVDGTGRVRLRTVGADALDELEATVVELSGGLDLPDYDDDGGGPKRSREPEMPLLFPQGMAVTSQYLYLADSGHHRVLECNHAGRILRQFGTGAADLVDGAAAEAAFHRPHGLCLLHDVLYVADSGNHAIRRIKLRSGEVETLSGTGSQGGRGMPGAHTSRSTPLDDPRAVVAVRDRLYIAMAGGNALWCHDLGRDVLHRLAGSGELGVRDGVGPEAAFAQPVSLAAVEQTIYVCDAAGSAIRSVQLRDNHVQTLVGHGPWQFGDSDGERSEALLQAPQAIALDPGSPLLWIADTGNDRLRSLRLGGGEVTSHVLSQPLHGPAGLAVGGGAVWIADSDAHAVLRLDPHTGDLHHVPVGE